MRSAASAAPSAAGTAEAVNRNGARGDPQVVDHLGRPGDEAAAGGERLGEGAHAQVDAVLDAQQLGGARAARAEHAGAVRLVDHQARAVALAQLDDVHQRRDVALHREDAVDDDQHAAAVALRRAPAPARACPCGCGGRGASWPARAARRRGSRRGRRSRRSPCRRGRAACRACPTLAWWPVVKTIASSVSIHSASSRSSSGAAGWCR